ncbi:2,3,4,5-tetrahydropyridine-2,6-dicarboxylate N-succinyltransferase [Gammaproteobacteria bacterium]|nr:2,3,4,5-tetrahydropyridine-2,6-dicarboxylate N-succinyltransferase [Gammaproteobacteria bacterium]
MLHRPLTSRTSHILQQLKNRETPSESDYQYIENIIQQLDAGQIRVSHRQSGIWKTDINIKEAVLCYLRMSPVKEICTTTQVHRDAVPPKGFNIQSLNSAKIRNLPLSYVRFGAYIAPQVVLMPCFINIGAYVGQGSMIDTWASIGSCAQIGKNCHISAGTGIGGVLEPLQANPTIIEDDCFIGGRCEISEGVLIKQGAVIASGTHISGSTKIYNRITKEITLGVVPKNAVVVPGNLPNSNGEYSTNAAIIVKFADHKTRAKTSINDLLREAN